MKKLLLGMTTLVALTFSMASSALSLDYFSEDPTDAIYDDTGAQFVDLTDLIYPASAPMVEISSNIQDIYPTQDYIIGIFDAVGNELDVLNTHDDNMSANVTFDIIGGTATSSFYGTSAMATTFGFYIRFFSGTPLGGSFGEAYYSNSTPDDMFNIFYDPDGIASTYYSETALGIAGLTDEWKTLIRVADVAPHTVPLPAAAWLFGSALLGLLGLGGRRKATTGASA
jgi:hypothetical protein